MKRITSFLTLGLAVIGLLFININAQSFVSRSNTASLDEQIAKKIRNLPNYDVFDNIDFEIEGSTVILTGKVNSIGTKADAAAEMKRINGIKNVVNRIEQLPASSFDEQIRRAALLEFTQRGPAQYFGWRNPDVRIIVEGGRLTLEGQVARKADKDMLNVLAHGISGVFTVTNNLVVGRRSY